MIYTSHSNEIHVTSRKHRNNEKFSVRNISVLKLLAFSIVCEQWMVKQIT